MLLIACADVGNLLMVRSFARRHEMSVRLAVARGARRYCGKQLLTEGLVLSSLGPLAVNAGGVFGAATCWCGFFPARGACKCICRERSMGACWR